MALAERYVERTSYTEEEYFEIERTSFGRWEYVNGKVRLMAGGSDDHGAISSNLVRVLGNALVPKGCRVYGSDVKIHTAMASIRSRMFRLSVKRGAIILGGRMSFSIRCSLSKCCRRLRRTTTERKSSSIIR